MAAPTTDDVAAACDGTLGLPDSPMIAGALHAVTVADVNGDGKPDLIGTNGAVSVRLSLGGGNFAPAVSYPAGTDPTSVAVADFNQDGKPDIAAANLNSKNVSVLLNQGGGTFAPKIDYATGDSPAAVAAGDVNGDGRPDLAVAHGDGVSVLLNKASGGFAAAVDYFLNNAASVAIAELTGDGRADIAVTQDNVTGPDYAFVLVNKGLGKFDTINNSIQLHQAGINPRSIVAADLTGDGKRDLAVANGTSGTVSVFVNKGHKTFDANVDYQVGSYVRALAAADLTGDGKVDLVAINDDVNVLANVGNGTFAPKVKYQSGAYLTAIAAADLTGDGKVDLAVTNSGSDGVSLMANRGGGTFSAPVAYPTGGGYTSPLATDLSGDGKPDLVVIDAGFGFNALRMLMNQGDGTFSPSSSLQVQNSADSVVAADFTGDGKPDLAVMSGTLVRVLVNQGNATFAPKVDYPVQGARAIVAADLNGDGTIDLALSKHPGSGSQGSISLLLNQGNGTFAPQGEYGYETVISNPKGIAAADLNGDGKNDLVFAAFGTTAKTVAVMLNRGDGTFAGVAQYVVANYARHIVATDLTGDGKPDIASEGNGTVSVLANLGDGTFAPKVDYVTGTSSSSIIAADLSDDGKPELVVTGHDVFGYESRVRVLRNDGNGAFAPAVYYAAGDFPESVIAADLTGDGRTDLAVANGTGKMTVMPSAGCLP